VFRVWGDFHQGILCSRFGEIPTRGFCVPGMGNVPPGNSVFKIWGNFHQGILFSGSGECPTRRFCVQDLGKFPPGDSVFRVWGKCITTKGFCFQGLRKINIEKNKRKTYIKIYIYIYIYIKEKKMYKIYKIIRIMSPG
jgi:hypothetical protein